MTRHDDNSSIKRALDEFEGMVTGVENLPLLEPALALGRIQDPDFDGDAAAGVIDGIEQAVRAADPGPEAGDMARLESLRRVLVEDEDFTGEDSIAGDPAASCLHLVLESRRGLPIVLAVLYLEMARRIDLPLRGVGMPGRYVVSLAGALPPVYLDPWDRGRILDEDGCAALLERITGGKVQMQPEFLRHWSNLRTLWRMLNNMKAAYVDADDLTRARQAVDRQILLRPAVAEPWRDRGLLAYRGLLFQQAVADLETYLEKAPAAADADAIRSQLKSLRRLVGSTN